MREVRANEFLYVLVTHMDKLDNSLPPRSDVYLGVIREKELSVEFCALEGCELAGLKFGQFGRVPVSNLQEQIREGITEKMSTDYYIQEFTGVVDKP